MIRVLVVLILFFAVVETSLAGFVPKAFEASFTQIKISTLSKAQLKSNVRLKYQFPSRMYMHTTGNDDEVIYVCNPKKVWIYRPPFMKGEPGQVQIGATSRHCLSKVFEKLNQGLTSNADYKVTQLKGDTYLLSFGKAAAEKLGYHKFELVFKSSDHRFDNLKLMRMYSRQDKNPVTLITRKYKAVKKFSSKNFNFTPPKNTSVDYLK